MNKNINKLSLLWIKDLFNWEKISYEILNKILKIWEKISLENFINQMNNNETITNDEFTISKDVFWKNTETELELYITEKTNIVDNSITYYWILNIDWNFILTHNWYQLRIELDKLNKKIDERNVEIIKWIINTKTFTDLEKLLLESIHVKKEDNQYIIWGRKYNIILNNKKILIYNESNTLINIIKTPNLN